MKPSNTGIDWLRLTTIPSRVADAISGNITEREFVTVCEWAAQFAIAKYRKELAAKAGDWEKELGDKSWTPSAGAQSRAVWLSVAKDILRRALSSAAPRITEEMVERVLDGIRVRGNTDRHHGIRTGIEKAKLAMIALLRQQGPPPFTPTQTEEPDA